MRFSKFVVEKETKDADVDKKHFGDIEELGYKIFIVNGEKVRNNCDVDFIGGGHCLVYDCIPEKEIWVEDFKHEHDSEYVLWHEVFEHLLMLEKSYKYEDAHDVANKFERMLRINTAMDKVKDQYDDEYFDGSKRIHDVLDSVVYK